MRKHLLGLSVLVLAACNGRVEAFRPLPNGDTASDESGAVGGHAQLENVSAYDDYANRTAYARARLSNAGPLDGLYDAWCVDPDTTGEAWTYPVDLYSSYASLPPEAVVSAGNLDLVNYLINTFALNSSLVAPCGGEEPEVGVIGVDDIQEAIWRLVSPTSETFDSCLASAMVARAQAEGEGFLPGCDDKLAVIALPVANQSPPLYDDSQVLALQMPAAPGGCP
jgi:hypothetical protein